jgi:hypothetical protein
MSTEPADRDGLVTTRAKRGRHAIVAAIVVFLWMVVASMVCTYAIGAYRRGSDSAAGAYLAFGIFAVGKALNQVPR